MSKNPHPIAKEKIRQIMNDLGLKGLYEIVDEPTTDMYLYCGKPPKVKSLEENIGKTLVINGKRCIITYPLQFLVNKGELYTRRFIYTIEVIKNAKIMEVSWLYKEGRIVTSA